MNLKPLVNNPELYKAFQEYLNEELKQAHSTLIRATDPTLIYRAQGKAEFINRLLTLRESVNGGST